MAIWRVGKHMIRLISLYMFRFLVLLAMQTAVPVSYRSQPRRSVTNGHSYFGWSTVPVAVVRVPCPSSQHFPVIQFLYSLIIRVQSIANTEITPCLHPYIYLLIFVSAIYERMTLVNVCRVYLQCSIYTVDVTGAWHFYLRHFHVLK